MKIAFATQDSTHINAHFGWARFLDVYEVDNEGYTFLETMEFSKNLKEDGNEDKLVPKLNAVKDCTIVYVSAIGGSAAARLIQSNVTPIKAQSEEDSIQDVLTRLVQTLNGSPPPWLRKALAKGKARRFEDETDAADAADATQFETQFETIEEEVLV